MPYDEFRHIWDRVKHFTKKLYLMGNGETFTHKDVYRILEYCKGPDIVIDTNGNVPLDFNRIIDSGIIALNFSVDGINQEMYEKYRKGGKLKCILDNISGLINEKQKRNASFPIVTLKFIAFKHNEMYILTRPIN